jgi:peroxiredoxin
MRTLAVALFGVFLCTNLFGQAMQPPHTQLKEGDMAPDFTLPAAKDGQLMKAPVKLSDFRGKSAVVLAFFPAAFSPGCTKEMLNYQTTLTKFVDANAQVIGISGDNTWSLAAFQKEIKAAFPMVSDFATRETMASYGVLFPGRGFANRATFVIDKSGKIVHIEEGNGAVDTSGAELACSRLAHSASENQK